MRRLLAVLAGMLMIGATARGDFVFTIETNADPFRFKAENTGLIAVERFTLEINPTKVFDSSRVIDQSVGLGITLETPDTVNGGLTSAVLSYALTGFEGGQFFVATTDIDGKPGTSATAYPDGSLYNVPGGANALLTVEWAGGLTQSLVLTGPPAGTPFSPLSFTLAPTAVPEPGGLALILIGCGMLMALRKRLRLKIIP